MMILNCIARARARVAILWNSSDILIDNMLEVLNTDDRTLPSLSYCIYWCYRDFRRRPGRTVALGQ